MLDLNNVGAAVKVCLLEVANCKINSIIGFGLAVILVFELKTLLLVLATKFLHPTISVDSHNIAMPL